MALQVLAVFMIFTVVGTVFGNGPTTIDGLKKKSWSTLTFRSREKLLNHAMTTTEESEIKDLIKLAEKSNDPRWIPFLEKWDGQKELAHLKSIASKHVSMADTVDSGELSMGLLPRGSALLTSSGYLTEVGIKAIVHAAPGSFFHRKDPLIPNIESLENSVRNSVRLAERFGFTRMAIPLIGGGIFLKRLHIGLDDLAEVIIRASLKASGKMKFAFVGFDVEARDAFQNALLKFGKPIPQVEIYQGSLTDFSLHHSEVIVNPANTEVRFGQGLSGVIAKESRARKRIDQEAKAILRALKPKTPISVD